MSDQYSKTQIYFKAWPWILGNCYGYFFTIWHIIDILKKKELNGEKNQQAKSILKIIFNLALTNYLDIIFIYPGLHGVIYCKSCYTMIPWAILSSKYIKKNPNRSEVKCVAVFTVNPQKCLIITAGTSYENNCSNAVVITRDKYVLIGWFTPVIFTDFPNLTSLGTNSQHGIRQLKHPETH